MLALLSKKYVIENLCVILYGSFIKGSSTISILNVYISNIFNKKPNNSHWLWHTEHQVEISQYKN